MTEDFFDFVENSDAERLGEQASWIDGDFASILHQRESRLAKSVFDASHESHNALGEFGYPVLRRMMVDKPFAQAVRLSMKVKYLPSMDKLALLATKFAARPQNDAQRRDCTRLSALLAAPLLDDVPPSGFGAWFADKDLARCSAQLKANRRAAHPPTQRGNQKSNFSGAKRADLPSGVADEADIAPASAAVDCGQRKLQHVGAQGRPVSFVTGICGPDGAFEQIFADPMPADLADAWMRGDLSASARQSAHETFLRAAAIAQRPLAIPDD